MPNATATTVRSEPRAPARPSAVASLWGAWGAMSTDPVGILLPAGGALLVDAVCLEVGRRWLSALPWPWLDPVGWEIAASWLVALVLARHVLSAPLRALWLSAGARAMGRSAPGLSRTPAILGVQLALTGLQAVATVALVVPALGAAATLASDGHLTSAAVCLAAGALSASAAALGIRIWLAFALPGALLGGHAAVGAIRRASAQGRGHRLGLAWIVLTGQTAVWLGGLACGAGALPGYPLAELAVLHRWLALEEE